MNNRNIVILSTVAVTFVIMFFYLGVLRQWAGDVKTALGAAIMVMTIIAIIVCSGKSVSGNIETSSILLAVFGSGLILVTATLPDTVPADITYSLRAEGMRAIVAWSLYFTAPGVAARTFKVTRRFLISVFCCQAACILLLVAKWPRIPCFT